MQSNFSKEEKNDFFFHNLDQIVKFVDLKVKTTVTPPKSRWAIGRHIAVVGSLCLILLLIFMHIVSPYRIWYPENRETLYIAIGVIFEAIFLIVFESRHATMLEVILDPWMDDADIARQRSKRIKSGLVVLPIILLISASYVIVDVALLSPRGFSIAVSIAAVTTVAIYLAAWALQKFLGKTKKQREQEKTLEQLQTIELSTEFYEKFNKEIELTPEKEEQLINSSAGRACLYYVLVIGSFSWEATSQNRIQIKNELYALLYESNAKKKQMLGIMDVIFSRDLDNLTLDAKKDFLEFLINFLDNVRMSPEFNRDYLYAYQLMGQTLKQYRMELMRKKA